MEAIWEYNGVLDPTPEQYTKIKEQLFPDENNMHVTLIDFVPTDEFILYEALIHVGILPEGERTKTWNNPDSPIHKAWEEFITRKEQYKK